MKVKKLYSLAMLLCLLIAGTLFRAQPVLADEIKKIYDSDQTGSIKVCLDDIGTPRNSVSLYCYKVGSPKLYENHLEGFLPEESFESLNLDLDHLGDTAVHRAYADSLVSFIEANTHIQPIQKGVTDGNGECMFRPLEQGIYLIVQKDSFDSYGTTEPFLMMVPYIEDDVFVYDVVTQTKGEKPVPPTETEPPDTEPGEPDKPTKTGDETPVYELTVIAFISAVCIAAVIWRRRKKKISDENI